MHTQEAVNNSVFAANLRVALTASPFTQEKLARELDITVGAVSRWLRGDAEPTGSRLVRLATVLGQDAEWFFTDHTSSKRAA